MLEEVGMVSNDWKKIYEVAPSDRTIDNPVSFWVASDPTVVDNPVQNPDMFIVQEQKWVDRDEFQSMVDTGEIHWSIVSMAALQVFHRYTK